eukprot:scaffold40245_cov63-Phaeocystis_antarctica.AAC.1
MSERAVCRPFPPPSQTSASCQLRARRYSGTARNWLRKSVVTDMGATQSLDSPASLLASLTQPEEGSLRMSVLQRAISHEGDLGRLDCLLEHLRAGGQTSVTLIGTPRRARSDVLHARVQRWLLRRFAHVAKAAVTIESIPVSGRDGLCAGWRLPLGLPRLVFIDTSAMNAARPRASRNASAADGARAAAAQLEALLRGLQP